MSGIAWWEWVIFALIGAFFLVGITIGIFAIRGWNRVLKEQERKIEARRKLKP